MSQTLPTSPATTPRLSSCRVRPYRVRSSRRGGTGSGCGHGDMAQRDGRGDVTVVSGGGGGGGKGGGDGVKGGGGGVKGGGGGVKGGGGGGKKGGVVVVVPYTVKL